MPIRDQLIWLAPWAAYCLACIGCKPVDSPPVDVEDTEVLHTDVAETPDSSDSGGAESVGTADTSSMEPKPPALRPLEIDPWGDDWSVGVPTYGATAPCSTGIAARIGATEFVVLQDALDVVVDYDIVEVCDGTHTGPFVIPPDTVLELRGRTGDPSDVVLNHPGGLERLLLGFANVDAIDGGAGWIRLSGLTFRDDQDRPTSNIFSIGFYAGRWDVRDVHFAVTSPSFDAARAVYFDTVSHAGAGGRALSALMRTETRSAPPVVFARRIQAQWGMSVQCHHGCELDIMDVEVFGDQSHSDGCGFGIDITPHRSTPTVARLENIRLRRCRRGSFGLTGLASTVVGRQVDVRVQSVRIRDIDSPNGLINFNDRNEIPVLNIHVSELSLQSVGVATDSVLRVSSPARALLEDISLPQHANTILGCGDISYIASAVVDLDNGECP